MGTLRHLIIIAYVCLFVAFLLVAVLIFSIGFSSTLLNCFAYMCLLGELHWRCYSNLKRLLALGSVKIEMLDGCCRWVGLQGKVKSSSQNTFEVTLALQGLFQVLLVWLGLFDPPHPSRLVLLIRPPPLPFHYIVIWYHDMGKSKNFVSDGTICTTFCPTQPNNKISTHGTHCGNVRYILGLFYLKILVVQWKINFWAIAW